MFETNFNLPKVRGTYRFNTDLSKTNWFRVGGPAEILFLPKDSQDLIFFLRNKPDNLNITVLGVGSNVIIKDGGISGVVIKLGGGFTKIEPSTNNLQPKLTDKINQKNQIEETLNHNSNQYLKIGCGCLCFNAAIYCKINGLGGLEFLSSIPGSIGGALAMNAGCYDGEIANSLISATAIDHSGNLLELSNQDFGFKYRGNSLPKNLIFIETVLQIQTSSTEEVSKKIANFYQKREASQPIRTKTGGSTFKNPAQGKKAWQLIDEAGCRGVKIGDAQISEKHCNFMINTGNAKAKDLIELANQVAAKVQENSGIKLEMEIQILGKE